MVSLIHASYLDNSWSTFVVSPNFMHLMSWLGLFYKDVSILRIAECGKLSRGDLRKIKRGTFRELPIIVFRIPQPKNSAFPRITKLPFAHIVQQMCNRCIAASGIPGSFPSIFLVVRLPKNIMLEAWNKTSDLSSAAFFGRGAGPHLTQCGQGGGLPACRFSSWSIQRFGHNTPTLQTDNGLLA